METGRKRILDDRAKRQEKKFWEMMRTAKPAGKRCLK
jgi:hypothetical protein